MCWWEWGPLVRPALLALFEAIESLVFKVPLLTTLRALLRVATVIQQCGLAVVKNGFFMTMLLLSPGGVLILDSHLA